MKGGRRTSCAVQVCEVEDVGCAALGGGAGADDGLALLDHGSSHGGDGEGEDGGEEHVEGWWFGGWLVGWLVVEWMRSGSRE